MFKRLRILFLLLPVVFFLIPVGNFFVSAQVQTNIIHFRICKSNIDIEWKDNIENIIALQKSLEKSPSSIKIKAAASPDGPFALNNRLAHERAASTVALIKRLNPSLSDSLIVIETVSEDVEGMISRIKECDQPWAEEALTLLSKGGKDPEEALRRIHGGKVWRYLADNIYPFLRRSEITLTYNNSAAAVPADTTAISSSPVDSTSNGVIASGNVDNNPSAGPSEAISEPQKADSKNKVPGWALGSIAALGAAALAFGLLFARERRRKRVHNITTPASPVTPPDAPVFTPEAPVSEAAVPPAPVIESPMVDPAPAAVAAAAVATVAAASAASSAPEAPEPPFAPVVPPVAPASSAFVDEVKAIIQENIADSGFGVEELASKVGISRIHLNRKLKAEGNTSPSVLLKEARMELAASLIKEGKLSIAEIAQQSGFSTPSYFATAFKDYYKISPSDFTAE